MRTIYDYNIHLILFHDHQDDDDHIHQRMVLT